MLCLKQQIIRNFKQIFSSLVYNLALRYMCIKLHMLNNQDILAFDHFCLHICINNIKLDSFKWLPKKVYLHLHHLWYAEMYNVLFKAFFLLWKSVEQKSKYVNIEINITVSGLQYNTLYLNRIHNV